MSQKIIGYYPLTYLSENIAYWLLIDMGGIQPDLEMAAPPETLH